jgi:hypothetical protein
MTKFFKFFNILLVLSSLTLASCANKSENTANTTNPTTITAANNTTLSNTTLSSTLATRAADCTCQFMAQSMAMTKKIQAAPETEKQALATEATKMMASQPPCMVALETELKAIPQEQQAAFNQQLDSLLTKQCGDVANQLNGQ